MTATTHRPRVCVLHTVTTLPAVFAALLPQEAPGVDAYHVVDESLLADTVAHGMRPRTVRRLAAYAALAEEAGARAVLVTCSSIGGAAELVRPHVNIPVLRVDEPMARQSVRTGRRIGVLATLPSTLGPTEDLIRRTAAQEGADIELITSLCPGAHEARGAGDAAEHDRLIAAEAERLATRADVLVLAQASMAQAVGGLPSNRLTVPVLTSPRSGAAQLAALPGAQAAAR
ncbi:aspartate/glutamate racemase family protein [Streptomyces sp. NPDC006393]|uniref:aspartate/glutamate racemase family protein n=1 Tax=Streptomyces sp. NPDC006393 TaxID=3156763 RepID=UPI0033FCFC67